MTDETGQIAVTEPALLIRIPRQYRPGMSHEELYDATRGVWRIGSARERARLALAVHNGLVLEVYEIEQWLPAGSTPYVKRPLEEVSVPGRWEFVGRIASADLRAKYRGRSVAHYYKRGNQSPVAYVNLAERADRT